jgi:hypothetical protein
MELEGALARGIMGGNGAILTRNGTLAAVASLMDPAAALEFSRFAARLGSAQPELSTAAAAMALPAVG